MTIDEDVRGEDETSVVEQTLRVETLDPSRLFAEIAKIEEEEEAAAKSRGAAPSPAAEEPEEPEEPEQEGTMVLDTAPMLGPRATNAAWAAKTKRRAQSTPPPPMGAGQVDLERGPGQTFVLKRSDPPPALQPVPTLPPEESRSPSPDVPTNASRRRRDRREFVAAALLVTMLVLLALALTRIAFGA